LFDDTAILEEYDMGGVADGSETMGDLEDGAVGSGRPDGVEKCLFCRGVEMSAQLVKEENRSVLEEGTGESEALSLTSREA
jgi:hypothetical protein